MEDLATLIDKRTAPALRGPYKKREAVGISN